jgi:hypothetical protein
MRNALGLLKLIAQSEEQIRRGELVSQEQVFADLDKLLAQP